MRRKRKGGWVWKAMGVAGVLLAAALALSWAPDVPVAALEARWAPPPSRFVDVDGLRVHLRDQGPRDDPSPIILLHGTSASLHTWEGWVSHLPGERVVSMDLPGFGLTGPDPRGQYETLRYVRFLEALMDQLGIDSAVIAGNSFGGQVAIEFALAHPARVQKLVLVDALAYPRNAESVPLGFRLAATPAVNVVMQHFLPRFVIANSVRDVYGNPGRVSPALVDRYYALAVREGNRAALGQRFRHLPTEADAARVATLRVPTLVLWGGRDRLIPPDNGQRLHRDIAGSQLVVFPALGHVPQEEDPAATVQPVIAFLRQP
jgi:pimeloyl-ACP methyl ester carboxylesterase